MSGIFHRILQIARNYLQDEAPGENGAIHADMSAENMWQNVSEGIQEGKSEKMRIRKRNKRRARRGSMVVVTLGVLSFFYYKSQPHYTIPKIIATGHYSSVTTLPEGTRQVVDSCGHAAPFDLTLPDSSTVRLCFGSSLRYSETFDGKTREVYLNGQALFNVAKNSEQPFIVHTEGTAVVVIGTFFNVMAYAGEPGEVTLISGAVQVIHGGNTLVLKPSEQAVERGDRLTIRKPDVPQASLSWTKKDPCFNFDNTDLNTAIRQLARWYQVRISNPDHVKGIAITGMLKQSSSLSDNLKLLAFTEQRHVHLEVKADTIVMTKSLR